MSVLYREICNGCGLWGNENEARFNILKIDLTNYLLMSNGFKLREPLVDICICADCYVKMKDNEIVYYGGDEMQRARGKILELESELEKSKGELRDLKGTVKSLLSPLAKGENK